jgi:hypothetical protein
MNLGHQVRHAATDPPHGAGPSPPARLAHTYAAAHRPAYAVPQATVPHPDAMANLLEAATEMPGAWPRLSGLEFQLLTRCAATGMVWCWRVVHKPSQKGDARCRSRCRRRDRYEGQGLQPDLLRGGLPGQRGAWRSTFRTRSARATPSSPTCSARHRRTAARTRRWASSCCVRGWAPDRLRPPRHSYLAARHRVASLRIRSSCRTRWPGRLALEPPPRGNLSSAGGCLVCRRKGIS